MKLSSLFRFFTFSNQLSAVNILHFFNDGFEASFILLLPFLAMDFQINLAQVGLLGAVLNACGVILALFASAVAAKLGGVRALAYIIILSTLVFVAVGFVPNFSGLIVMFIIAGIGYGLFHPLLWSALSHLSTKETRGRVMGDSTAIGDIGRIGISALITFLVAGFGWRNTSFLYGAIGLAIGLFIYFKLRKNQSLHVVQQPHAKINFVELFSHKRFILAVLVLVGDVFASLSLYIFLPFLFLKQGISPAFLGVFTAVFFAGNFGGKLYFGRLADKYGNAKIFLVSETLMAAALFLLAHTVSIPIIIALAFALGALSKGTIPIVGTIIAESAEHHGDFSKTFSVTESISSLTRVIAPIILGFISAQYGIIMAFNVMAAVALIALVPAIGFQMSKAKS